jgi:hypothetical protein
VGKRGKSLMGTLRDCIEPPSGNIEGFDCPICSDILVDDIKQVIVTAGKINDMYWYRVEQYE